MILSYKTETTLETLGLYNSLDRNNRQNNNELLAVRIEQNEDGDKEFLTKINRSDVTCWNLFLRIFNCGILSHTHISIKSIDNHLFQVFKSPNFTEDHKMVCDSQAYKTVCKIRDWSEKKGEFKLNQFVSSFLEFRVQGEGFASHEIRYTFDAPLMNVESFLVCEKKLQEEANQKRKWATSEVEKYHLDCRDIINFEGDGGNSRSWEEFLSAVRIRVGPVYGTYVQNSVKGQRAKILKFSDHQANVRRIPGKITNPLMESQLALVDAQRLAVSALTLASATVPQQGNFYPMGSGFGGASRGSRTFTS